MKGRGNTALSSLARGHDLNELCEFNIIFNHWSFVETQAWGPRLMIMSNVKRQCYTFYLFLGIFFIFYKVQYFFSSIQARQVNELLKCSNATHDWYSINAMLLNMQVDLSSYMQLCLTTHWILKKIYDTRSSEVPCVCLLVGHISFLYKCVVLKI